MNAFAGEGYDASEDMMIDETETFESRGSAAREDRDTAAIATMESLLRQPDPLDEIVDALKRAGCWLRWTFGRQLWYLRVMGNLTQSELSRRSGVSQHRISRIEGDADARLSTIRTLFRTLGYEPVILPDSPDREKDAGRRKKGRTRPAAAPCSMSSATSKPSPERR